MKKVFMSIMAIAAIAFTMTSCNKDEAVNTDPITVNMEDNEILNSTKVHVESDGHTLVWDDHDQVRLVDANKHTAIYNVTVGEDGRAHFTFVGNDYGQFDRNAAPIQAFYPVKIGVSGRNTVTLGATQNTVNGEATNIPMYGEGDLSSNFTWRNVFGMLNISFTAPVTVAKIAITTDKFINGIFTVNVDPEHLAKPLTYKSSTSGHGSKTSTLVFANGKDATNGLTAHMWIPAETYQSLNITIYTTDGKQYTKRSNLSAGSIDIIRTTNNNIDLGTVTAEQFETLNMGAASGIFAISETQNVRLANGNLQFVNFIGNPVWRFADNQWDCLKGTQTTGSNAYDRDLISWGANKYFRNAQNQYGGNTHTIWQNGYSTATALAGTDEWGNNRISNATGSWRTLTSTEWDYLINNANPTMVTLAFANVSGYVLFPNDCAETCTANASLTKAQWNALENAGCVFLPVYKSRTAKGNTVNTTNGSYYWASDGDENNAYAINATATALNQSASISKKIGAYIRLAQDVENRPR